MSDELVLMHPCCNLTGKVRERNRPARPTSSRRRSCGSDFSGKWLAPSGLGGAGGSKTDLTCVVISSQLLGARCPDGRLHGQSSLAPNTYRPANSVSPTTGQPSQFRVPPPEVRAHLGCQQIRISGSRFNLSISPSDHSHTAYCLITIFDMHQTCAMMAIGRDRTFHSSEVPCGRQTCRVQHPQA